MFRARVVNPRWIAAMRRHGYKGAFELAATVDYLFGYDATAGVVADWMYEKLAPRRCPATATPRPTSTPQWMQARRAALYDQMITDELADGETGGFLVWGDPSLYDGTLNLLRDVATARGSRSSRSLASAASPPSRRPPARSSAGSARPSSSPPAAGSPRRVSPRRRRRRGDARRPHCLRRAARYRPRHLLGRLPRHPDEILVAGALRAVRDQIARLRAEARPARAGSWTPTCCRRR